MLGKLRKSGQIKEMPTGEMPTEGSGRLGELADLGNADFGECRLRGAADWGSGQLGK